jgi:Fe-S-cluster containining protein
LYWFRSFSEKTQNNMNFCDMAESSYLEKKWRCVKGCGACCHLDPSDRPDLADYLSPGELELYLSMVGEEGWCINYDRDRRECQIYDDRPHFCRVLPETFQAMFGIERKGFNDFAIACCQEQIAGVYGEDSLEMDRYNQAVAADF